MVSPSIAGAWVAPLPVTAGILATSCVDFALGGLGIAARGLDQPRGHALLVVEQRLQQMRRRDPLVMLANRDRLRRLQEAARAVGQLFKIHSILPLVPGADMVLHIGNTRLVHATGSVEAASFGLGGAAAAPAAAGGAGGGAAELAAAAAAGWPIDAASSGWTIGGHSRGDRRVHVPAPELGAVDVEAQKA